jgi:hypothetical protein
LADRHPSATSAAAHQTFGEQEQHDDGEDKEAGRCPLRRYTLDLYQIFWSQYDLKAPKRLRDLIAPAHERDS